jgi:hypothetical protein
MVRPAMERHGARNATPAAPGGGSRDASCVTEGSGAHQRAGDHGKSRDMKIGVLSTRSRCSR